MSGYHDPNPVRWSNLKRIAESPMHYLHGLTVGFKVTDLMRMGAYAHAIALGQPMDQFAVYDGVRRGKAWDAFARANFEKEILNVRESSEAESMAEGLMRNADVMRLLQGSRERRIDWEMGGRACRGTPDVSLTDDGEKLTLSDIKFTSAANPRRFFRHADQQGWPVQLCWYANAMKIAEGVEVERMVLVAVEQKAPYCATVFELTKDKIEEGHKKWRSMWELLRQCEDANHWPGYSEIPVPFDVWSPDDYTADIEEGVEA